MNPPHVQVVQRTNLSQGSCIAQILQLQYNYEWQKLFYLCEYEEPNFVPETNETIVSLLDLFRVEFWDLSDPNFIVHETSEAGDITEMVKNNHQTTFSHLNSQARCAIVGASGCFTALTAQG